MDPADPDMGLILGRFREGTSPSLFNHEARRDSWGDHVAIWSLIMTLGSVRCGFKA